MVQQHGSVHPINALAATCKATFWWIRCNDMLGKYLSEWWAKERMSFILAWWWREQVTNTWSTQQHFVGINMKMITYSHQNKVKTIHHSFQFQRKGSRKIKKLALKREIFLMRLLSFVFYYGNHQFLSMVVWKSNVTHHDHL